MAGWRSIDLIDFEGEISYSRGHLVLFRDGVRAGSLPLEDLNVVLLGLKVRLNGAVLQQAANFDVTVIPCHWNGLPMGALQTWSHHTRTGLRQLSQVAIARPKRKIAWKNIVVAKITGQAAVLAGVDAAAAADLLAVAKSVKSGDSGNAEAIAARKYWSKLFADRQFSRDRMAVDAANCFLNYGYTVLRGHAVRAVIEAGLSPGLGLFHRGRANPFNLADDVIEPFRPAVDQAVVAALESHQDLNTEVKRRLAGVVEERFCGASGRSLSAELSAFAQHLGLYFEGQIELLSVPRWAGRVLADDY